MVEGLPQMSKVLGSIPSMRKKKGFGEGEDGQIQIYKVGCDFFSSRQSSSWERTLLPQVAKTVTVWLLSAELSQS